MNATETLHTNVIAKLERRVAKRLVAKFRTMLPEALIHRAIFEAREMARRSGWPVLVFPVLAEETVSRLTCVIDTATLACAA
jgi:hypothetical protein